MIAPTRLALAALALLAATTAAFAQVTPPPRPGAPGSEEPPPARIHLGPVGVRRAVIFREVGYDSNVLNRNTDEQGDFTATVGGRVDLGARVARFLTSASTFYERGSTSRSPSTMGRIVSGWGAEGSASASVKTRGSPSTTTTPSATRRHRRASTHAAGCMQR